MLSVSPATRVFVALKPIDMRRSFNGLYAEVQSVLKEDPLICVGPEYVSAEHEWGGCSGDALRSADT